MKMVVIKFFILLFGISLLQAGTYDDYYTVLKDKHPKKSNDNTLMMGTFAEIIRFDPIHFDDDQLDEGEYKNINEIADRIESFVEAERKILVSIIGYTNEATDDPNEKAIDSQTYANAIQNIFRDHEDTNSTLKRSKRYAQIVRDILVDEQIDESLLKVEYRGGMDLAYTDESEESRDLSNRVAVTIYVYEVEDIDSDKDGVFDKYDRCDGTPRNSKVDKLGCPIDSDRDGVLDYKDECTNTPKGIEVNYVGCPIDTDNDGVADYKDACPDTAQGVTVDPNGCPIKQTLALHFKPNSDKILAESEPIIENFANFLKKNKAYKVEIIGHTDSVGKAAINMKLSEQRAAMAKKALVAKGIDPSRITTRGRGELDPIASNRTKKGRKANRRIEIKLSF